MSNTNLKRHSWSPAYISSSLVIAYIIGAAVFSVGIAYLTRQVISPWWLGVSIMAIVLYQLSIFWLLLQYWEPNKILGIFTSNILCLGLVFAFFEYILSVRLPVDLPILSFYAHLGGLNISSLSPGQVALSYAALAILIGYVFLIAMSVAVGNRWWPKLMKRSGLAKIDLAIDHRLDKISHWLDKDDRHGLILPQVFLVFTLMIVIGLAWLI